MKQKHLWVALVAVIIIAGAWWWMDSRNQVTAPEVTTESEQAQDPNQEQPQPETPPKEGQATNQFTGNNNLSVSDQIAGEKSVTIDNANLDKAGFIAIWYKDQAGATQILGNTKILSAGSKQDLEVMLKQALTASQKYSASIYLDDGDKIFNKDKDAVGTSTKSIVEFSAK